MFNFKYYKLEIHDHNIWPMAIWPIKCGRMSGVPRTFRKPHHFMLPTCGHDEIQKPTIQLQICLDYFPLF